ncbi:hypothetical protein DFH09DRAFT_1168744 [Mycena vulgaris]|nr:hypothetical protein DFH09DRAFT_1168744 [Mycena vulgaris]
MAKKTTTPWMSWLKARVKPPRWPRCPKGGHHSASIYAALNEPVDEDRFGEYTFYCNKGCHKPPINRLSADEKKKLYAEFLAVRKEAMAEQRLERAQARSDAKTAMEVAAQKPAPRPRKKQTTEVSNAIVSVVSGTVARSKETATPRTPAGETALDQPDSGQFAQGRKGKGKAKADPEPTAQALAVENDEYDSETYEIDDDQRRSLQLIIYTDPEAPAIEHEVNLRAASHFDFTALNIAKAVGAVSESDSGLPFDMYMWYCVIQDKWLSVASPINLQPRGKFLICRKASLADNDCPGIDVWVELAVRSALEQFEFKDSEDDADGGECEVNYELEPDSESEPGPSSSLPTAPPASSPLKSSPVKSLPSRKRKAGTSSGSVYLDEQTQLLDEEEEGGSPAKRHKSAKAKEVFVVSD